MGQKVNPKSIRLLINEKWNSLWFSSSNYTKFLISDIQIRKYLMKKLKDASVSDIVIGRDSNKVTVDIYSARPGVIIGRGGAGTEEIRKLLSKQIQGRLQINIVEIKKPDSNAAVVAQGVVAQVERRMPFRRVLKQAVEKAKNAGVKGIKIMVSGRLNGAEIARSEKIIFGTVPLSTFKSDIDYAYFQAHTTYGVIGVKVWIYKGEGRLEE